MSSLAAIFQRNAAPVSRTTAQRLQTAIALSDQEAAGQWSEGPVFMGHSFFYTTPESRHERQPVSSGDGSLVLVADARVDNRDELLSSLGLARAEPTLPDSQLILQAYARWGQGAVSRILGDFAFVVWDEQHQRLFCARDRLGIRPLYYVCLPHFFAIASAIPPLLGLDQVSAGLNQARLASYIMGFLPDNQETLYSDIHRLPPGHMLEVGLQSFSLQPYWSPLQVRSLRLADDQAYAEAFGEVFSRAVACRLRSAYPVAATLSGGLDSSSIVCTADRLWAGEAGPPLHALSAVFPSLPSSQRQRADERSYMTSVTEHTNCSHHLLEADQLEPFANLAANIRTMGEPFFGPNMYLHEGLYQQANHLGARVFLDGIDGDTVVSHGLERFPHLLCQGSLFSLFRELFAMQRVNSSQMPILGLLWLFACKPLVPGRLKERLKHLLKPKNLSDHPPDLLNPDLAARVGAIELYQHYCAASALPMTNAEEHHKRSLTQPLLALTVETCRHLAAQYRIEPSYPFLDSRVVEFCLSLPPEQKFAQGWSRMILRRAMAGILPEAVQWRTTKADLSPVFCRSFQEEQGDAIRNTIASQRQTLTRYYNEKHLDQILEKCLNDPYKNREDCHTIYTVLSLLAWLDQKT